MRLFIPRQPLNHIAPLPRSLWDSEVVGWVVRYVWLNQNNVFVGILHARSGSSLQCPFTDMSNQPPDDLGILAGGASAPRASLMAGLQISSQY